VCAVDDAGITSSAAAKKWLPDADFEIEGDATKGKTLAPQTARQSVCVCFQFD
jgi:hypothetical protein